MHEVSQEFLDKFKRAYGVSSTPKIVFEWNLNRLGQLDAVRNGGWEASEDSELFPLESIILPNRPTKPGILKGIVSLGNMGTEAIARTSTGIPQERRTYVPTHEAKYKYWISPRVSEQTMLPGGGYRIYKACPMVTWLNPVNTNKIYAQFETSGSSPKQVEVSITRDGFEWEQLPGEFSPDENGRIELWLQDDGTWSQTKNLNNYTQLEGLQVTVKTMTQPFAHAHVIEIALKREVDLTDRVVDYSFSTQASEASFVAPLGSATSSTGSITLSNYDGRLDHYRESSDLYKMMKSPAKVTATIEVDVDGVKETMPHATMYVESWGESSDESRKLSLTDGSMPLKEVYPEHLLFERVTGTEIIWRLLDSAGFSDFIVDEDPTGDMMVDYFWTDSEKTVWDHIKDISEGLQIAVYFDETGTLRIRSRERLYENDKSSVEWTLDAEKVTDQLAAEQARPDDIGKLPDIISVEEPSELHANKVVVEYTPTKISDFQKGIPEMETVWEEQGTVALRSARLARTMSEIQVYGSFTGSNFDTWPYEGYLNIEGEVVKWYKKRYRYVNENYKWETRYIASDAEKVTLDARNVKRAHQNHFDGHLYFGKNRGMMSTVAREHKVGKGHDSHGFKHIRTRHYRGKMINKTWYTKPRPSEGLFTIKTSKAFKMRSATVAKRAWSTRDDRPPIYIGTSLKFNNLPGKDRGAAGIYFGGETMDSGYLVDLRTTEAAGNRKVSNELSVIIRDRRGNMRKVGGSRTVGVVKGKWYDIDVYSRPDRGDMIVSVYINGVRMHWVRIPKEDLLNGPLSSDREGLSGIFGVYGRGYVNVDFEYLYGSMSGEYPDHDNEENTRAGATRFDLIDGGLRSRMFNKLMYGTRQRNSRLLVGWSAEDKEYFRRFYFDEFGVTAHEIRTFDVEFDPAPVIHSRLYLSNEWYADLLEYYADSKSATFTITSKGRNNVTILSGEDNSIYGEDNPVQQMMLVYGRIVDREDVKTHEERNEDSIRASGEVEVTLASEWIQNEESARKVGQWVANHWGDGSESIEITSFGNPLLQIGDIVAVSFPRKAMAPETHHYYVTGVQNSYSEGLTTTLNLQKKTNLIAS